MPLLDIQKETTEFEKKLKAGYFDEAVYSHNHSAEEKTSMENKDTLHEVDIFCKS